MACVSMCCCILRTEDTAHILQRITGSKASFTIPKHPDDHTERVPTPKRVLGNLGLASA